MSAAGARRCRYERCTHPPSEPVGSGRSRLNTLVTLGIGSWPSDTSGDLDGGPVGGAMVMLVGNQRSGMFMGPVGSARTLDSGRFEISDVPPGSYQANASVARSISSLIPRPPPADVVVTDADVTDVRVTVVATPPR